MRPAWRPGPRVRDRRRARGRRLTLILTGVVFTAMMLAMGHVADRAPRAGAASTNDREPPRWSHSSESTAACCSAAADHHRSVERGDADSVRPRGQPSAVRERGPAPPPTRSPPNAALFTSSPATRIDQGPPPDCDTCDRWRAGINGGESGCGPDLLPSFLVCHVMLNRDRARGWLLVDTASLAWPDATPRRVRRTSATLGGRGAIRRRPSWPKGSALLWRQRRQPRRGHPIDRDHAGGTPPRLPRPRPYTCTGPSTPPRCGAIRSERDFATSRTSADTASCGSPTSPAATPG